MPVQINPGIAPKQEKENKPDTIDLILKGLQIAHSVYGIREAGKKMDQMEAQTELAKQKAGTEAETAKLFTQKTQKEIEALDRQQQGIVTNTELLNKAGSYQAAKTGDPDAIPFRVQRGESIDTVYLKPPKAEKVQDPLAREMMLERTDKYRRDREADARAQTPAGKIEKLGVEGKNKVGMYASMLETITDYETSFRSGDRPSRLNTSTPLIGGLMSDTTIDLATRKLSDDIGRARSGGAINKDEEGRFLSFLPRPGDSDEIATEKIVNLRKEIGTKIRAIGITPEELPTMGYDPKRLGVSDRYSQSENRDLIKSRKGVGSFGMSTANADESDVAGDALSILNGRKGMKRLPK